MSAPIVEALPLHVEQRNHGQSVIYNRPTSTGEQWDAEYVNFSGYFGEHGPDLFAAAPDLLAALEPFHREWLDMGATAHLADKSLMLDVDGGGEILTVGDWRKLIAAIAKAKGGAA